MSLDDLRMRESSSGLIMQLCSRGSVPPVQTFVVERSALILPLSLSLCLSSQLRSHLL